MAPAETGGVLAGYWTENGENAVITDVVGPGNSAVHSHMRFEPDYEFQEAALLDIYEHSGRTKTYLGDWHTHPNGVASLSRLDARTLRFIARAATGSHPVAIMAILSLRNEPELGVWFAERRSCFPRTRVRIDTMQLQMFGRMHADSK